MGTRAEFYERFAATSDSFCTGMRSELSPEVTGLRKGTPGYAAVVVFGVCTGLVVAALLEIAWVIESRKDG